MTTTTESGRIVCPACRDEASEPTRVLKRSLRKLHGYKAMYVVQYECPDCALRWWGHEWERREN